MNLLACVVLHNLESQELERASTMAEESEEEDEATMDPEVETSSLCTLSSHESLVTPDLWQHLGNVCIGSHVVRHDACPDAS